MVVSMLRPTQEASTVIKTVIGKIFALGPFWFGIGFIAPVIAAFLNAGNITAPLGLSPIVIGLLVGGITGLIATKRGSWL